MVTRVGKFVGGLGQDITNTANAHATENRIAFGAAVNPVANVHVVGNVFATTTIHSHTGFLVPNDGDIGSLGATDAIQISSGGIVTFKDDIKIKDGGTIGTATDPAAITIAAAGGVTFSDAATFTGGVIVPDDGDVGSASATDAIQISSGGIVTFKDDILLKDGGTIGVASAATAITIASTGIVTFVDDIVVKDDGTIGSATAPTAMTIDSSGIVAFVDDIKIKDAGTIGSASDPDAIAIGADGDVTLSQDLELQHDGATISFGGNDEIVLTHVHDTGLKLTDTGGSPTLQLHDASEAISSDGSKLILTSNGVAFNMPTADGDAGQLIKTNGSGTLSFVSSTGSINPATTLSTSTDCGSVGGAETTDAFGQIISDDIIILNLLVDATDQLGIADQGALT